jgi:hypothetical protein
MYRDGGAGTAYAKGGRIFVLELTSSDVSAFNRANQQTSSTTPVDAITLNFTPATEGDYLFIASAELGNAGYTIDLETPSGAHINQLADDLRLTTAYCGWAAMWRETVPASASTAKIRWWRSVGTGNGNFDDGTIVGLRLDQLVGAQTAQTSTPSSGTDTSYVQALLLSATGLEPTVRPTFLLAFGNIDAGSTSSSSYVDLREDSTALMEGLHVEGGGSRGSLPGIMPYRITQNAADIDFDIRRKSESAITSSVTTAALAVIELNTEFSQALSASVTQSPSIRKTMLKSLAAQLVSAATLTASTIFARAMSATVTLSATMRRQVHKGLSATLSLATTICKTVSKSLSDTLTLTATIAKAFPVRLVASLSATASITKMIAKTLSASLGLTATMQRVKTAIVHLSASLSLTASLATIRVFQQALSASITLTASMTKTISKRLVATQSMIARPIRWVATLLAATRGDKPNWNQCARCSRKVRPNKLLQQMEYRGPRLVWTGLYVCSSCIDEPQPQGIWPRETGGDPKPVILARPRRD